MGKRKYSNARLFLFLSFLYTHQLVKGTGGVSTDLVEESQVGMPVFMEEPPNQIDFLNEKGAIITCTADGQPLPEISWRDVDNKILSSVDHYRTVLANGTLFIHPFEPSSYRQDIHHTRIACVASNPVGAIRSRDVQVRAVIAQQWLTKVTSTPSHLRIEAGPILFKCEVDLMGGGRDFIEVIGWRRDGQFIPTRADKFYGDEVPDHWHVLPNGDLTLESLLEVDIHKQLFCISRHRITQQEIVSSSFTITLTEGNGLLDQEKSNIPESFPAPIVVREGYPIVLHCYESSSLGRKSEVGVRWEKLSGSSWQEIPRDSSKSPKLLRQIGNSLVKERSTKANAGHYRCSHSTTQKIMEFEVRVSQPLSVKMTINQPKSQLGATVELTCSVTSSSYNSPSVVWLKDGNIINPGGRIRFFSTNVLQINQIQKGNDGIYQCLSKTEMESAQDSVRLELADIGPRLIDGFSEASLMPGPSISFRCGFSGWPTPKVTWFQDNWPVLPDSGKRILTGNITLHGNVISYLNISQTEVEDSGWYSCRAVNRAGMSSHAARLNIYGPLWIRIVPPLVAISGEFFLMNCPISGWPITFSSVVWEKDGEKLPGVNPRLRVGTNGSLSIHVIDKSDSGSYYCSIQNIRREIRVNVVAPLRIAPFPENGSVVEGDRLTLVCALSSGDPPVEIRWIMLSSRATDPSHYSRQFSRFSPSNEERNRARRKHASVIEEDSSSSLFSVLKTDPYTSLLTISKATEAHNSARFTCYVSGVAGVAMRSYDLTVLVPTKIEPFAFQDGLIEGKITRIVCGVSQGDLPIEFAWFIDGKPFSRSKNDPRTNNVEVSTLDPFSTLLSFSSLTQFNSAIYKCVTRNAASEAQFAAKLVVQVAPKWVKEPEDGNATRGSEVRLECAGYGVPDPKIRWYYASSFSSSDQSGKGDSSGADGKWRPVETIWPSSTHESIFLANGTLIFPAVDESHEGEFLCSVTNGIGSGISKAAHLRVLVPPYFVDSGSSRTITLTQGKSREISCEAVSSSPIYLSWSKGTNVFVNVPANRIHTVVGMEDRRTKSTLVIRNVSTEDGGLYKATASNSLGKVSRIYRLVVEEHPKAPERLRLAEESRRKGGGVVEATRVYLEWDPPSEYSSKETRLPGESSSKATTAFPPPILTYIVEFSLNSEQNKPAFSRHIEVPGAKTIVKVDGLTPASEYVFRVRAVNSAGNGPPSNPLFVRTAVIPPAISPSNGRAEPFMSSRTILVTFSPIPVDLSFGRVLAYRVELTPTSSPGNGVTILVPSAASNRNFHNNVTVNEQNCCQTVIHGLSPFTHYEIKLGALNIAGLGPLSPPFSIKTGEEIPQLPPRNPQCLSTSNSIEIKWQHPLQSNGPITSYKLIFYPLDSTSVQASYKGQMAEIHRSSSLTAVIGGLQPNTNYSFYITPINTAGEGRESSHVFCKTSESLPSSPSNLIGFPSSPTSVYLSWLHPRKPNGILTNHNIYFRMIDKNSDSFQMKRTVPGNIDFYEETGLDLTRFKYVFWVTSKSTFGESQPSSQLIFNPPPLVERKLVGQSKTMETKQGNPLTLPCRILGLDSPSSTSDLLSVSWTVNGKRVTFDGNVYMKPGQTDLIFFGVRKSDEGNYTCKTISAKKAINGMDSKSPQQLTYRLHVKGPACTPEPSYRMLGRDVLIEWSASEVKLNCDDPLGFILYYRTLGSILDWTRIVFQPTQRNYTLREITCGSILNMYMAGFNEVGSSSDSHLMSVVVSHSLTPFPPFQELIVPNITSVLLNLYPLNANSTFCPVEKFSVGVKELKSSEWLPGKDVKNPFRNEIAIDGLKPSSVYEITITTYGYSTSRTTSLTFFTLTEFGETLSPDVISKYKVTSEYSSLYNGLTVIGSALVAICTLIASISAIIIYRRNQRRIPIVERNTVKKHGNYPNYHYPHSNKGNPPEEPFYSGIGGPPTCTSGLDDISPYATFHISDSKKFHEEAFINQEIVVAKFHPVMHAIPRGSRDKWIDRDPRQMQDSEDEESEHAQRYSAVPFPRSGRLSNLYQINPPNQPPPPLPYQPVAYAQPHHVLGPDNSDVEDDDSSGSDPSKTTIDRRTSKKQRKDANRKSSRELSCRFHHQPKESGSSHTLRSKSKSRRATNNMSDYSIAV